MTTDDEKTLAAIWKNGYVKPGATLSDWRLFMANGGLTFNSYVLVLDEDMIEFKARDDQSALQYVSDTFIPETEFNLYESIHRRVN